MKPTIVYLVHGYKVLCKNSGCELGPLNMAVLQALVREIKSIDSNQSVQIILLGGYDPGTRKQEHSIALMMRTWLTERGYENFSNITIDTIDYLRFRTRASCLHPRNTYEEVNFGLHALSRKYGNSEICMRFIFLKGRTLGMLWYHILNRRELNKLNLAFGSRPLLVSEKTTHDWIKEIFRLPFRFLDPKGKIARWLRS